MKHGLKIDSGGRMATKADGTRIPVLDAEYSCLIQPNEEDVANGVKGDHARCMYCLACRRMYGSDLVWITRSLAYVELRGKNGKPELRRFYLKAPAQEEVKAFDSGGQVARSAVIFAAPTGSHTLEAKAAAWRRWQHKRKGKGKEAYIKGEKKGATKAAPVSFIAALREPAYGMFQFRSTQKQRA